MNIIDIVGTSSPILARMPGFCSGFAGSSSVLLTERFLRVSDLSDDTSGRAPSGLFCRSSDEESTASGMVTECQVWNTGFRTSRHAQSLVASPPTVCRDQLKSSRSLKCSLDTRYKKQDTQTAACPLTALYIGTEIITIVPIVQRSLRSAPGMYVNKSRTALVPKLVAQH